MTIALTVPEVVQLASPAIVRIETSSGVGSGFIVDASGYIITNNHVVVLVNGRVASTVDVLLSDGTRYTGRVAGADARSDIALIKIEPEQELTALEFADLDDVRIGENVVAIGYALDLAQGEGASFTVTTGIVSQKNRAIEEDAGILGAVQTDAAINHGNSGGPLLNMLGQVVGVNAALQADSMTGDAAQGIGYAIGSDMVRAVYEELKAKGSVDRGLLGVQGFEALRPAKARELGLPAGTTGVYLPEDIASVQAGGPAARAGIRAGDVISRIGDQEIESEGDLAVAIIGHAAGSSVEVELCRDGEKLTVTVTLGTLV